MTFYKPCRSKTLFFDLNPKGAKFWVHKIVLTGGHPAPQTPWRGACSPACPPAYREAPPLGLSVDLGTKILVPRSWYQDLGTKILVPRSGTKILARPGMARHRNIWHGTDRKGTARKYLARHGSTRSWHRTARDIPDYLPISPPIVDSSKGCLFAHKGTSSKHNFSFVPAHTKTFKKSSQKDREMAPGGFFSYQSDTCQHFGHDGV